MNFSRLWMLSRNISGTSFCYNSSCKRVIPKSLSFPSYHSARVIHKSHVYALPSRAYFSSSSSNHNDAQEFTLKVDDGHIAGKIWNAEAPVAVLCIHGYLDNAGSFDTLVPLLPRNLCCVSIDLPGHGWSSHYPPGTNMTLTHYTIAVERIVKHFGWKNVSICDTIGRKSP